MEELGDQKLTVALFDRFPIRRTWHKGEWFYSMVDVIAALVDTPQPRKYWSERKSDLKRREHFDVYAQGVKKLGLPASDGRMAQTDCASRQTVLRLIQSIPSPNVGPLKLWLAQVGEATLHYAEETDDTRSVRAQERWKLHQADTYLHQIVMFRGITTPEQHERLANSNYAGLYGIPTRGGVARAKGLRPSYGVAPEETMGVLEAAINTVQRAGTAQLIEQRNIQGEDAINATAEDVGVELRLMMERTGLPMPEDLPRYRALQRDEWVPEGQRVPGMVDWEGGASEGPDRVIPIYEVVEIEGELVDGEAPLPYTITERGLRLIGETHINPQNKEEDGEE